MAARVMPKPVATAPAPAVNAGGAATLQSLQAMWQSVKPQVGGFIPVPEGAYVADLKEMKLVQAKKGTGRWQVDTSFEIVVDQQGAGNEGNIVKRFDGIEDPSQAGFFKGLAETLGLTLPQDITQLQPAMDAFVEANAQTGEYFDIYVKIAPGENGKTYTNVYVNGVNAEFSKGEAEGETVGETDVVGEAEQQAMEAEQISPMRKFATPNGGAVRQVAQPAPVAKVAAPIVRKSAAVIRR